MTSHIPRIQRPYYRNGESHRSGADVDFADIVKLFGFRTAKIGKWVSKEEQQLAANLFFDALADLMDILQVPPQVISLNGSLSLAFGTGGQKHSSAHYELNSKTLALAKNAGGGSLAHEWFHAFDHYICRRMFARDDHLSFASACWLQDEEKVVHPLNQILSEWFKILFLSQDGSAPSEYVTRSAMADRHMKFFYYARPQEMAARAFEACIQDNPIKNSFLVQGTKQSSEAMIGVYPKDQLRQQSASLILRYFHLLGGALDRQ